MIIRRRQLKIRTYGYTPVVRVVRTAERDCSAGEHSEPGIFDSTYRIAADASPGGFYLEVFPLCRPAEELDHLFVQIDRHA